MDYYVNPQIPEDMDEAQSGHLRSFVLTFLKSLAFLIVFVVVMDIAARLLAPFVPFKWEKALAPDAFLSGSGAASAEIETQLNSLGQRLAAKMDLPPDLTITIHYDNDPMVNAMATFGGHIIVFKGLLEKMESEDALAAVLAHEIADVKHRDVIKGLWRAVSLWLLLAAVDSSSLGGLGDAAGETALMSYSRGQERRADEAATEALGRLYGHTQGFERSFLVLVEAAQGGLQPPEILSSHPDTQKRIDNSKKMAARLGYPVQGESVPLPPALILNQAPKPDKNRPAPKLDI